MQARKHMAHKAKNIYYLTPYRKSLQISLSEEKWEIIKPLKNNKLTLISICKCLEIIFSGRY